ncbi:PLP-dependent transferase [Cadophora sp. DSE1049]|nr:PLP-dependent transferase [Cadophora sp. DSE1049]
MSRHAEGRIPSTGDINLQLGWPSPSLFPSESLNLASNAVLSNFSTASSALIYGPSLGSISFRSTLSIWLSKHYYGTNTDISHNRVYVTSGASAALAAILSRFTDPGYTRNIWMVEPTYFLACPIFQDAGFTGRLRGVPEDDDGIDLGFLRAGLERAEFGRPTTTSAGKGIGTGYPKLYKHLIYCVPTFSNPSGKTMSFSRREGLVKLARSFDALVVSDDVYDFLRWPGDQIKPLDTSLGCLPPRLIDIDKSLDGGNEFGNTVSNGSFSKIVAPGTRVGWLEAAEPFISAMAKVGVTSSGGGPSHLTSTFMEKMITNGALDKHIAEKLIPTYSSRYHAMMKAIGSQLFPLGVKITTGGNKDSVGGFFTSLSVPDHLPPTSILASLALKDQKLKFAYGEMFEVVGDDGSKTRAEAPGGFGHTLRLCWAWHIEDEIEDGVRRLGNVLRELIAVSSRMA